MAASSHVSEAFRRLSRPRLLAGLPVTSPAGLVRAAAAALHGYCDGRGLANSRECDKYHRWVNSGSGLMSGQDFISAIKIRGNLVANPARCARGRPEANYACDANCRQPGSLGHILQSCYRTWGPRIKRHDAVLGLTEATLNRKGWASSREPAIPTPAGTRKPNLIVWRESCAKAAVIDVTVVADNASLGGVTRWRTMTLRLCENMPLPSRARLRLYSRPSRCPGAGSYQQSLPNSSLKTWVGRAMRSS